MSTGRHARCFRADAPAARCRAGQPRAGQPRLGQTRLGQTRLGQTRLGQTLGAAMSWQPDRRSLGVGVAGFANFLNLYTTQAILPEIARAFGVGVVQAGLTLTAPLLAVALVAPFAGTVSDRLGRKRLIVGAGLLGVVPTLLAAAASGFDAMVLWRFLQGLLLPFGFAVCVAYIGEECPGAAGIRAAGSYSVGTILGGFSGRMLVGVVRRACAAGAWDSWRSPPPAWRRPPSLRWCCRASAGSCRCMAGCRPRWRPMPGTWARRGCSPPASSASACCSPTWRATPM